MISKCIDKKCIRDLNNIIYLYHDAKLSSKNYCEKIFLFKKTIIVSERMIKTFKSIRFFVKSNMSVKAFSIAYELITTA